MSWRIDWSGAGLVESLLARWGWGLASAVARMLALRMARRVAASTWSRSVPTRACTRRSASSRTLLAMTAERATDTARTTSSRVAAALVTMRAGIDRRLDVNSTTAMQIVPAARTQLAAMSDPA